MPTNHTDVDQFTTVVKPNDGEVANVASVRQGFEPLADRTYHLRQRILGGLTDGIFRVPLVVVLNVSTRFALQVDSDFNSSYGWKQTDVTDAGSLVIPIPIPAIKGTLSKVTAYLHGGAHTNLPATKPTLNISRSTYDGSSPGAYSAVTDPSATQPAYDAHHTIEHTLSGGLAISNTTKDMLYAIFTGETGANSLANQLVLGAIAIEIDPS